jgi:hypothetical protein
MNAKSLLLKVADPSSPKLLPLKLIWVKLEDFVLFLGETCSDDCPYLLELSILED